MDLEKEMRGWLKECFSEENDREIIDEMTNDELLRAIIRYFDGGMEGFKECTGWKEVEV